MPTDQSPAPTQVPAAPVSFQERIEQAKVRAVQSAQVPPPNPKVPVSPRPAPEETETFKRLTAMTRTNRELSDKVKAYDEKLKTLPELERDASLLRDVIGLYKSGKKVEAVAKLAGNDNATAEMQLLLADYLGQPDQDPAKPEPNPLELKVKELTDRLDKEQADKAKAQEQAQLDTARSYADTLLDEAKDSQGQPQFELCSRPDNRQEAYDLALHAAAIFAEAKGLDPESPIPPETSRELMLLAYAEVEKEFEEVGKRRYLKGQSTKPQDANNGTSTRPAQAQVPASTPTENTPSRRVARTDLNFRAPIVTETEQHAPGHLHPDEALRRLREKYRTAQ